MIETFFQVILDLLASSTVVRTSNLTFEVRSTTVGFIRGNIDFIDGSRLHVRELIDLRSNPPSLMYAFHYLGPHEGFVFRYDNTRHYPDLPGFPYHKHDATNRESPSEPVDLATVLNEIEKLILTKNFD